jgi:hypothetical protein
MKAPVFLLAIGLQVAAGGVSEGEPFRSAERVEYEGGAYVEVRCDDGHRCSLEVSNGELIYKVPPDRMRGLGILPSGAKLVVPPKGGSFVVEVDVVCSAYADSPPAHTCMGQLTFAGGILYRTTVFRRTFQDEFGADFAKDFGEDD